MDHHTDISEISISSGTEQPRYFDVFRPDWTEDERFSPKTHGANLVSLPVIMFLVAGGVQHRRKRPLERGTFQSVPPRLLFVLVAQRPRTAKRSQANSLHTQNQTQKRHEQFFIEIALLRDSLRNATPGSFKTKNVTET